MTPGGRQLLAATAQDLTFLARFHDRELDAEFIEGLRQESVGGLLSVAVETEPAITAIADLDAALAALPANIDDSLTDRLAAEFASIYLCHNYRISPAGSVWLTEECLERQEPMFEARKWYEKHDIKVADWRVRSDDHIVHELQFLSILCQKADMDSATDAAGFLDQCVLVWVPGFATAMKERVREPLYIAAAGLTAAYLEELRDLLEEMTGISRPVDPPAENENLARVFDIDQDRPYMPGLAESW